MAEVMDQESAEVRQMIEALSLEPHVEGGYYRRIHESDEHIEVAGRAGQRHLLTSIHYLLTRQRPVGHLHRNRSGILHYFHHGSAVRLLLVDSEGNLHRHLLGSDLNAGHELSLFVPGGWWKCSELVDGDYGLISEAVAPGFDYRDMELISRDAVIAQCPQHLAVLSGYIHGQET